MVNTTKIITKQEYKEFYLKDKKPNKKRIFKDKPLIPEIEEELLKRINDINSVYIPLNVPSSKNHKQIHYNFGKINNPNIRCQMKVKGVWKDVIPYITNSDPVKEYEKAIIESMYNLKTKFKALIKGKVFPLDIEFTFIRSSNQHFDYINISQIILDQMQQYNWIPEDDNDHVVPSYPSKDKTRYFVSAKYQGVIIKIL